MILQKRQLSDKCLLDMLYICQDSKRRRKALLLKFKRGHLLSLFEDDAHIFRGHNRLKSRPPIPNVCK